MEFRVFQTNNIDLSGCSNTVFKISMSNLQNHLLNFFKNVYNSDNLINHTLNNDTIDRTRINILGELKKNKSEITDVSFDIELINEETKIIDVDESVYQNNDLDFMVSVLSYIHQKILQKDYLNDKSRLRDLDINITSEFIIISTDEICENLRHVDKYLDVVLHQMKLSIFDKNTFMPICYLDKAIKESETSEKTQNSYLKNHVYDVINNYHDTEFDHQMISIYKHHIGSYMIIFNHNNKWYFTLHTNVYELNNNTHPVLFEHIGDNLQVLDKNLCYHIVLIDMRIRRLIVPICERNHMVLINVTEKYTLNNVDPNMYEDKLNNIFVIDKRIYFSCFDELCLRLEELDVVNTKTKKLINRGYIVKVRMSEFDNICISYDTYTYKRLMNMVPSGMTIHEVHLKLYQLDKLSGFLQYINDSHVDIVKRINISMSTISREILDIYHMTRKKKNSDLYNILPQSYKQLLYQLHSKYISKKNKKENNSMDLYGDFRESENSTDSETCEINDSENTKNTTLSVSVDNVYTKLKELDTNTLVEIYKDREELIKKIQENKISSNPIKICTTTRIQSKLLSVKSHI